MGVLVAAERGGAGGVGIAGEEVEGVEDGVVRVEGGGDGGVEALEEGLAAGEDEFVVHSVGDVVSRVVHLPQNRFWH